MACRANACDDVGDKCILLLLHVIKVPDWEDILLPLSSGPLLDVVHGAARQVVCDWNPKETRLLSDGGSCCPWPSQCCNLALETLQVVGEVGHSLDIASLFAL